MHSPLYTIGHSNHELSRFVALLGQHRITAVGDVRSSPYSGYNPQFNRETLRDFLKECGIAYVFLGEELGARRKEADCYDASGRVLYDRVARTPAFRAGVERLKECMREYRVALMCAEKDPLTCHRTLLICRYARDNFPHVRHIREDGALETHSEAESRLLKLCKLPERDLFHSRDELIAQAYEQQGARIAYVAPADHETAAVSEESA